MSLFSELRRRNVIRVAIAYAIAGWLLIQVSETIFPVLQLPGWTVTLVTVLILLGFPLALLFAWAFELTPDGIKLEKHVVREESVVHLTGRKLDFVIIATLALALGFVSYDRFVSNPPGGPTVENSEASGSVDRSAEFGQPAMADHSIAVLPFQNRSALEEDAYFADGIHDDILMQLSNLSALDKVISRTSVEQYRETTKPIPQIGEELGVTAILQGGVQRSGDQIRLTMQLIDAQADSYLWSDTFERQLSAENLFTIQGEISKAVAGALQVVLSEQENENLGRPPTTNLDAYREYLLGRREASKRTAQSVLLAQDHFERAIELDPGYALAYVGLATAIGLQTGYADRLSAETFELRQAAIDKALELDPQSGEAYALQASLYRQQGRDAEELFRKAIELSPNHAGAYHQYSSFLSGDGRDEEALRFIRKATDLDPLEPILTESLSIRLWNLGRVEEAQAELRRGIQWAPDFPTFYTRMAWMLRKSGQIGEAMQWVDAGISLDTPNFWVQWYECDTYFQLGDYESGEICAHEFAAAYPENDYGMINLHVYRSEFEQLVELTEERARRNPTFRPRQNLAMAYLLNREPRRARSILEEQTPEYFDSHPVVIRTSDIQKAVLAAYTLYEHGDVDRANYLFDEALKTMQSMHRTRGRGYFIWDAFIHATRNNKQEAISALSEAIEAGWRVDWWFYPRFPAFDSVRDEPEWIALMDRLEADIARQRAWYEEHKSTFEY